MLSVNVHMARSGISRPRVGESLSHGVRWATVALLALAACGGRTPSGDSGAAPPQPVAECVQYEGALKTCFHRDSAFASQPGLLPQTDADRDRIRAMCAENLRRLTTACR